MFDTPLLLQLAPGILLGLVLLCYLVYIFITDKRDKSGSGDEDPSKFLLNIIKARRTITPKDFNGNEVTQEELKDILEAANWAPTHKKTEPWLVSTNYKLLSFTRPSQPFFQALLHICRIQFDFGLSWLHWKLVRRTQGGYFWKGNDRLSKQSGWHSKRMAE